MKIELNSQTEACCREVFRQTKLVQTQAEGIVPDVYEDVGQIVFAQAQLCLKSKEVKDRRVVVGAEAQIAVYYITENHDRVRCINMRRDVETDFECPSLSPDAVARVRLRCMGVQARAVNPRKITAQLSVRTELVCFEEGALSIPDGTHEEGSAGMQLRQSEQSCVITAQASEKSFVINEQLSVESVGEPSEISCVQAALRVQDCQLIGSKALLKGSAEIKIICEEQDDRCPFPIERRLPFSVLVEMPDEDCTLGEVVIEPTALYADLGDAINGSRVIELELHAVAQLSFERRLCLHYLSDAYSCRCPVILSQSECSVCTQRQTETLSAETTERLEVEKDRGEVSSCFADILSYTIRDGKAEISAAVGLLLRTDAGEFGVQQRLLSLEVPLPDPAGEIADVSVASLRTAREQGDIVLTLSVSLAHIRRDYAELRYLSALELDEDNAYDLSRLPALTVAKQGSRELWDLAKNYHSSVEAIEELNAKYAIGESLLLIPRL